MPDFIQRFKTWATGYKNSWALVLGFIMMLLGMAALLVSVLALNK